MRKISISLAAILLIGVAQAQPNKGRFLLGGALKFNNSMNGDSYEAPYNFYGAELGLTAGFFPTQGVLLALNGGYSDQTRHVKFENISATIRSTYNGGIILRRYYPLGRQFYFTLEGSADYARSSGWMETSGQMLRLKTNAFTFGLGPGVSYSFGKRILFDVNLGRLVAVSSHRQMVYDDAGAEKARIQSTTGGFGPGGEIPLNIGFNILLGK